MQKKTRELYGVQILRGIAACAVILHHSLEESNGAATAFSPDWLTTSGASGVDIFFVISGFIMLYTSFPTEQNPLSPRSFFFRRATRIYPLYWICCLVMLAITLAGFLKNHHLKLSDIALSMALLPSSRLIVGVSWTLVYEIYFYLIFAVTLLFRSAVVSVIGTTAAIVILGLAGEGLSVGTLRTFLTDPIPYEFVLGIWLAIAFMRATAAGGRWPMSSIWSAFGFILLAIASLYVSHTTSNGLPGWSRVITWGLPAALIVAAFLSIGAPKGAFQRRLVFLGDSSYALYLTHAFVMIGYALILKTTFIGQAPQVIVVPLIVMLALIVGVVAHMTVEKPLLRMIRHWTTAGRRLPEATA